MTKVKITEDCGAWVVDISGHAGYARRGKDIVCAAISSLSVALIATLTEMETEGKVTGLVSEIDDKSGRVYAKFMENDGDVYTVINCILNGFVAIRENFPKNIEISAKWGGQTISP